MTTALLLAIAVLATSTLSGVFGMGGGMILMGIPSSAQLGVQGILTIAAVAISLDRKRLVTVK